MRLRKLEAQDGPLMLEWMGDRSVTGGFRIDFAAKTLEDCLNFIEKSIQDKESLHLAVVDDNDTYMGTVSLKHITGDSAEFAIVVRAAAMGKGYSRFAMGEMLRIGFDDMGLRHIFWSVRPDNIRALRFYDKNHYQRADRAVLPVTEGYSPEEAGAYIWYLAERQAAGRNRLLLSVSPGKRVLENENTE